MVTILTDSFQRASTAGNTTITNAAGWGATSSDGNTWSAVGGSGTPTYSITSSNQGQVTGISTDWFFLLSTQTHTNVLSEVIINSDSAASANNCGFVVRYNSSSSLYWCSLGGSNILVWKRNVSSNDVQIASGAATDAFTTNTDYQFKFQINGSTLQAKLYKLTTQEPSSWNVTVTDTDFSGAGKTGLAASPDSTSTHVKFRNYFLQGLTPPSGGIIYGGSSTVVMSGTIYG